MITHTLPMDVSAGDALREWAEFDNADSPARKAALFRRYLAVKRGQSCEPVTYVEGASGQQVTGLCLRRETVADKVVQARIHPLKKPTKNAHTMPRGHYDRAPGFPQSERKKIHGRIVSALDALGYKLENHGAISAAKKLTGISAETWHAGVTHGTRITPNYVEKLCGSLGIRREWVMDGAEPMLTPGAKPFVRSGAAESKKPRAKRPVRDAAPEAEPEFDEADGETPLPHARPLPGSPFPAGTLNDLVAQLSEQTRIVAAARERICVLAKEIAGNVAA